MKLLGITKKDVDADKNNEHVPKSESVEVVLVHCKFSQKWLSTLIKSSI